MNYYINDKNYYINDKKINEGDMIKDFRDELYKFIQVTKQGKIYYESPEGWKREFFPSVFNGEIRDE